MSASASTVDVMQAYGKVEAASKNADHSTRRVESMKDGQFVRQGDIYIVKVTKPLTEQNHLLKTQQLVPGQTLGSRHIAATPARLYEPDTVAINGIRPTALRGPIIVSDKRFEIEHPEHATVSLPGGTYQVINQLDAQTQRRVED